MQKIKLKTNALIKRNKLIKEIHKEGIRINKGALNHLCGLFQEDMIKTIRILAKTITAKGKKTISAKDIDSVFEKIKKKEEVWEI